MTLTDAQKIDLMKKNLLTLREDANMALSDSWDRNDSGFEAQIELIDETLEKCGITVWDDGTVKEG